MPHRHRVAAHDGPNPFSFYHEAERVLGVAVLRGVLTGHQVLDGGPQRRGGVGTAAECGVGQVDGAEGELTVTEVAARLGVARSTAHRLLAMLVYRDFAVQTENRAYRAGPVLELAAHSQSEASRLRAVALPHVAALVDVVDESANLMIRTGDTARFVASVECRQALRVGNREGMVFPAHRVTGGLVLLAELSQSELEAELRT